MGNKVLNVYVAPYFDKMWHDSSNILEILKRVKKNIKTEPFNTWLAFQMSVLERLENVSFG